MKKLREGYTTGSCATAGAMASSIWQLTGKCPERVTFITPSSKTLNLEINPLNPYQCGVIKDAGDDPDQTNKCIVITEVDILKSEGEIIFKGGEGVGIVTAKGLKIPVGEPAINPVPRQMITSELRKIIGSNSAVVTISVPNGEKIAEKTFNGRLGIKGGISILGTTGIVRPMSEEAIKDSMLLELSMHYANGNRSIAFVMGNMSERQLIKRFPEIKCIVHCSNYVGFMLDSASEMGFKNILIFGQTGKLVKLAADIMNTHSHIADGRNEVICTFAAIEGANKQVIKELYTCITTQASIDIIKRERLEYIWQNIINKAQLNCIKRINGKSNVGLIYIDGDNNILAETDNAKIVIKELGNLNDR